MIEIREVYCILYSTLKIKMTKSIKIFILVAFLALSALGCRKDIIRIKVYQETDLQPDDRDSWVN